ncbi:MAG: patatin-like phospholipase family protein [Acidobacteria bacterium]|nr:patatin-like phospholipase family protein [Acidobacteriota bacterium]
MELSESRKVVLVLAGGGSKGAVEVGGYRALVELGLPIDSIVGASIGAINGALIASGIGVTDLVELWQKVKFSDLFAFNRRLLWSPSTAASLYENRKLRRFLDPYLPARFEELLIPLTIIGTDLRTGQAVLLERGTLMDAILASVAVPGLLPPVMIEGREIVDGGLVNNLPLDVAAKKGARLVVAVRCGCRRPLGRAPQGLLGILSRSFDIGLDSRSQCELEPYKDQTRFVVFEPCLDENISLLDFTHSAELIEIGYQFALNELRALASESFDLF